MQQKFDDFAVNDRIILIMKKNGHNKNSLSKLLGVSQPALRKIEEHLCLPSFKLLFEIKRLFPTVNSDWLLIGNGPMEIEGEGLLNMSDNSRNTDARLWGVIDAQQRQLEAKDQQLEAKDKQLGAKDKLLETQMRIIEQLSQRGGAADAGGAVGAAAHG